MHDVFLSYSRKDAERAMRYAEWLTRQGWSIAWDQVIPPGQKWDEAIERQLNEARCVVVLWSNDSVRSDWVKTEAAEAVKRRVLVPVLIDRVDIPLEFKRVQALDLSDWDLREETPGLGLLRAAIVALTERQPTPAARPPNAPKARTRFMPRVVGASLVGCLLLAAVAIYFSDVWRGSGTELALQSGSLREDILRKFEADTSAWPTFLEEKGQVPLEQAVLLSIESLRRGGGEAAVLALQKAAILIPRPVRQYAHKSKVTAVAVSVDGKLLATGSEGDGTGLWDFDSARQIARLPSTAEINDIAFSDDAKLIATAGRDGVVGLWRTDTGERVASLSHPAAGSFGVQHILLTPDGTGLVSLENRIAHVWSLPEGREVLKLEHGHHLSGAKLSRDGRNLFTWGTEQGGAPVSVWDLQSGKLIWSPDRGTGIACVSVGSSLIAIGRQDQVSLWRVGQWSRAGTIQTKLTPRSIAFGPDDALLAIGGSGYQGYGPIAVVDVRTSEPTTRILSQTKNTAIDFVRFSPDASKLVGVGRDQSAQVLDTRTGAELVRARTGSFMHLAAAPVAYSADGRYVVSAGAKSARLWDTTPVRNAIEGCALAGRNFSRSEWRTFFGNEPYRQTCAAFGAEVPAERSR